MFCRPFDPRDEEMVRYLRDKGGKNMGPKL